MPSLSPFLRCLCGSHIQREVLLVFAVVWAPQSPELIFMLSKVVDDSKGDTTFDIYCLQLLR